MSDSELIEAITYGAGRRTTDAPIHTASSDCASAASMSVSLRRPIDVIFAGPRYQIKCHLRAEVDECIRRFPDVELTGMCGSMDIRGRQWFGSGELITSLTH
jgi:hypothetical protein